MIHWIQSLLQRGRDCCLVCCRVHWPAKSMFGTGFILHILQNSCFVLNSIGNLVVTVNTHYVLLVSTRSQLWKIIENICRNANHTHRWSHFSRIVGQLLRCSVDSQEQLFLTLILLRRWISHNAIHMIENVVVVCGKIMECDCLPLWNPQGRILEWSQSFRQILDNRPFILCCEEWLEISIFWILEPLAQ